MFEPSDEKFPFLWVNAKSDAVPLRCMRLMKESAGCEKSLIEKLMVILQHRFSKFALRRDPAY
jgi:hypothetical protein